MKKIFYIIITVTLLVACDKDYLEVTQPNDLTFDQFWKTENDAFQAITSAYAPVQYQLWDDQWGFNEGFYLMHEAPSDLNEPSQLWWPFDDRGYYNSSPTDYSIRDLWKFNYYGIFATNQVLENVPGMTIPETQKAVFIAEAHFLRAYYYFVLVNDFRNVIIFDKVPKNKDEFIRGQSKPEEVYALIEADLKEAKKSLPLTWDSKYLGRATLGAATALLGKVYLYQKKWADAEKEFKEIYGKYSLVSGNNYAHLFDGTMEHSSESIFEINFSMNETAGRIESHSIVTNFCYKDGWSVRPSQFLKGLFMEDKDANGNLSKRVFASILFNNPEVESWYFEKGDFVNFYGEGQMDDAFYKKYNYHDPSAPKDESFSGINFIIIRYADVLLMLAEALNEQNKTAEAIALVNEVRTRAGSKLLDLATGQNQVRDHIRNVERPLELCGETTRFSDLKRWYSGTELKQILVNHNRDGADEFEPNKDEYLPIPYRELTANPKVIQNPGYN